MLLGALETGGTKMVCALGNEKGEIFERESFPTRDPESTFADVIGFFAGKGIEALGSSTASIFCLFEPIGSVICGALFLHENLTLAKILGCLIIILAVVLLILAGRQKSER